MFKKIISIALLVMILFAVAISQAGRIKSVRQWNAEVPNDVIQIESGNSLSIPYGLNVDEALDVDWDASDEQAQFTQAAANCDAVIIENTATSITSATSLLDLKYTVDGDTDTKFIVLYDTNGLVEVGSIGVDAKYTFVNGMNLTNGTDTEFVIADAGGEDITLDLDTSTDNEVVLKSGSGVTQLDVQIATLKADAVDIDNGGAVNSEAADLTIGDGTNDTVFSDDGKITQTGDATLTLQDGSDLVITANSDAGPFISATVADTKLGNLTMGSASVDGGVLSIIKGTTGSDPTFSVTQAATLVTLAETVGDIAITAADDITITATGGNVSVSGAVDLGSANNLTLGSASVDGGVISIIKGTTGSDPTVTITQSATAVTIQETVGDIDMTAADDFNITATGGDFELNAALDVTGTIEAGSGNITLTNATGNIDGEVIQDDTIDDDSIDLSDVTLDDFHNVGLGLEETIYTLVVSTSLVDTGEFLATAASGKAGFFDVYMGTFAARGVFDAAGAPTLAADMDEGCSTSNGNNGTLNIYDGGTNIVIENQSGSTRTMYAVIRYVN